MSYGYTYTFPALRGIQAGREYFVAMCPLKLLPKIFLFDEAPIPPELRAQRTLNRARVPEIAHYILKNRDDYAFSAITASVDGEVRFEPANTSEEDADVGWLTVPMSARFVINDGQHRRAAIEAALEEDTGLGDETIAVVLFLDAGLHRSQQLFADTQVVFIANGIYHNRNYFLIFQIIQQLHCSSHNFLILGDKH